ncbi:MAG: hypothetical protein DRJ38_00310 [Thermoprotei archaeon]|nr:MAG: hypothetical protein DRJ38_00310 [Thermoprotei archaeon]
MRGYSDGRNLHVTFEGEESLQLVLLLGIALRALRQQGNQAALREAQNFYEKLERITFRWR